MTVDAAHEPIIETAARLEEQRRHSEHRLLFIVLGVQILLFLLVVFLGLGAFSNQNQVLDELERQNESLARQNEQLAIAVDEARLIASQNAERQDRILLAIGDRLVPKAEVKKLERQVVLLRREAVKLRQSIRKLTALVAARTPGGG